MTSAHYHPTLTGGVRVNGAAGGAGPGPGGGSFVAEWWDGDKEGNVVYDATWDGITGLARATKSGNEDYLWMSTDGTIDKILAVRTSQHASGFSGDQGEWTLQGVTFVNVTDITSGVESGVSYLYIWDGGNSGNTADSRGSGIDACIYRVKEPTITGVDGTILSADIEKIDVAYPAANIPSHRDAECIMFDPIVHHLYILTKRVNPPQMYRLPLAASFTGTQNLTYSTGVMSSVYAFSNNYLGATDGGYCVGGDISPDGAHILLKNYTNVYYIPRDTNNVVAVELVNVAPTDVPGYVGGGQPSSIYDNEPLGGAVCWGRDGQTFYTMSAGGDADKTGASVTNFPLRRYDMAIKATTNKTFQYFVSPFAGWLQTSDTYVMQSTPSTIRGTEVNIIVDKDYTAGSISDQRQGLIKFTLSGEVPSDATVIGAVLELNITGEGQDFDVHAMYAAWTENSTWNTLSGGVSLNGTEASATPVSRHGAVFSTVDNHGYDLLTGTVRIQSRELLTLVQEWVDGSRTNNGLVIINGDSLATNKGDGFVFASAENTTASLRPKFKIRYYQP